MSTSVPRCWHCNKKFSTLGKLPPGVTYWFTELEIEPGRKVKVHKCCFPQAREGIRKITAANMLGYQQLIDDHEET